MQELRHRGNVISGGPKDSMFHLHNIYKIFSLQRWKVWKHVQMDIKMPKPAGGWAKEKWGGGCSGASAWQLRWLWKCCSQWIWCQCTDIKIGERSLTLHHISSRKCSGGLKSCGPLSFSWLVWGRMKANLQVPAKISAELSEVRKSDKWWKLMTGSPISFIPYSMDIMYMSILASKVTRCLSSSPLLHTQYSLPLLSSL